MRVTAEQVKKACLAAGINRIDHPDCGGCEYMTAYLIKGENLFFDPGCDCSSHGCARPELRSWQEAADWINMQTHEEQREATAKRFGLIIPSIPPTKEEGKK